MSNAFDTRLLKFGVVGVSGMLIDFGITWLLKEYFRVNRFVANACGFCLAVTSNYLLNRNWTFGQTSAGIPLQFSKFFIVSLTGLAINTLLLFLFTKKTRINFYVLKLFVIGIVFFWNYFINLIFTFR